MRERVRKVHTLRVCRGTTTAPRARADLKMEPAINGNVSILSVGTITEKK